MSTTTRPRQMSVPELSSLALTSSSSSSSLSVFSMQPSSSSSQTDDGSPPDSPKSRKVDEEPCIVRLMSTLELDVEQTPRLHHQVAHELEVEYQGSPQEDGYQSECECLDAVSVSVTKNRPKVLKRRRAASLVAWPEPADKTKPPHTPPRKRPLAAAYPPKPKLLPLSGTDSPSPIFPLPAALLPMSSTRFSPSPSALSPKPLGGPEEPSREQTVQAADRLSTSVSGPLPSPWSPLPPSKPAALGLGFDKSVKTSPGTFAPLMDFNLATYRSSPLLDSSKPLSKKHTTTGLGLGMPTSRSSPPGLNFDFDDDEEGSGLMLRNLALEFASVAAGTSGSPCGQSPSPREDGRSVRRPLGRRLSDIQELISSSMSPASPKGKMHVKSGKAGVGVLCSPLSATRAVLCSSASWVV